MLEQLQTLLLKAGEQLGVAAEVVWEVLLQQTKVELAINIVTIVLAIAAVSGGIFAGLKLLRAYEVELATMERWERHESLGIFGWLFLTIPTVLGCLTVLFHVRETAQLILNPPMWVFEYLVRMFR